MSGHRVPRRGQRDRAGPRPAVRVHERRRAQPRAPRLRRGARRPAAGQAVRHRDGRRDRRGTRRGRPGSTAQLLTLSRAGRCGSRDPSSGRDGPPRRARRGSPAARSAPGRSPSWSTRMIPRQTSSPMKSASSSGPIGWLSPTFAPVSMSSAVPSPSSNARIASPRNGIRIRLTMNPGRSADDDHLLAHLGRDAPGPPPRSRRSSPARGSARSAA